MTYYMAVRVRAPYPGEPVELFHEVGKDGVELRRVELMSSGELRRTDEIAPERTVSLSLTPLPTVDEIDQQTDFDARVITAREFEDRWGSVRD